MSDTIGAIPESERLEREVSQLGERLRRSLSAVFDSLPGPPSTPAALVQALSIDKVLASRLRKALRSRDPIAVAYHLPGPEPVRRAIRAARRRGADPAFIREAEAAVLEFETLIRRDAGDRGAFSAILSAWLPEARREHELRNKQAAYRALSQLHGVSADTNLSTVLLSPSSDGVSIDVVWVFGLLGLRRLRPGVGVKFVSRRLADPSGPRVPATLGGKPLLDERDALVPDFSDSTGEVDVHRTGDVVHYSLAGREFGPKAASDVVLAEVNRNELARHVDPARRRRANFFAEVGTPVKRLHFDVIVHDDLYPEGSPELAIYDTAIDGTADPNDPSRDLDRLDLLETIQPLGHGVARAHDAQAPHYVRLLRHAFGQLGWDDGAFRIYRTVIDYPVYGAQVAMLFTPPPPPDTPRGDRTTDRG